MSIEFNWKEFVQRSGNSSAGAGQILNFGIGGNLIEGFGHDMLRERNGNLVVNYVPVISRNGRQAALDGRDTVVATSELLVGGFVTSTGASFGTLDVPGLCPKREIQICSFPIVETSS